jgi:IS605 OrfB family transposase
MRVETRQTAIDQVRIVPHASYYTLEVIYERPVTPAGVDATRIAAIDSGVNTLAAVTANQLGAVPLRVHGRPLKAINQGYNKRRAQSQAKLPEGVYVSRPLDILADKRGRRITAYLHGASRRLVDWLIAQRIGALVIGKHDGWKQAIGLGKRTNQNVVFAPHARFIEMLRYKAELIGIQAQITEESYPSQATFLDGDPQPVYAPAHAPPAFSGRRVKRGRYRAADGRRINTDINGAYHIVRKVVPNAFGNGMGGVVVHPVRIALAHGPHGSTVHVA